MMLRWRAGEAVQKGSPMGSLSRGVVLGSLVVACGLVLGRFSGLFRETTIAYRFGAGPETDAYLVAILLPTVLNNLVAGGTLQIAIMPILSRHFVGGRRAEAWRFASGILTMVGLAGAFLSVALALLAPQVVPLLAYGLDPATQRLAVDLLRLTSVLVLLLSLLSVLTAILNSLHYFVTFAAMSLVLNLCITVAALLGHGLGMRSVAMGYVAGSLAMVLLQVPALRRRGARLRPSLSLPRTELAEAGRLFLPAVLGSGVANLNPLIDKALASGLRSGSISTLNYADMIVSSAGMVGIALAMALFPALNDVSAEPGLHSARRLVAAALRFLFFFLLPTSVFLAIFAPQVVGVVLEHGSFDSAAATGTMAAVRYYLLGAPFVAGYYVLARAFYSLKDVITPLKVGAVGMVIHAATALLFSRFLAHGGIALSTSLTAMVCFAWGYRLLSRKTGGLAGRDIATSVATSMLASWGVLAVGLALEVWATRTAVSDAIVLLAGAIACVGAFVSISHALHSREWGRIKGLLGGKIRGMSPGRYQG